MLLVLRALHVCSSRDTPRAWWLQINATTADVSLCSRAEQIGQANIPLQLVSGWLDSTAAAAINLYHYCGQSPGTVAHKTHSTEKYNSMQGP